MRKAKGRRGVGGPAIYKFISKFRVGGGGGGCRVREREGYYNEQSAGKQNLGFYRLSVFPRDYK